MVEESYRLGFFKRIADICLFILGMFPEYAELSYVYPLSGEPRPQIAPWARRSMEDYENEGRRYYELAAEHPAARAERLAEVFETLHENFYTAKKPLNFIAEHYIHYQRRNLFGMETPSQT